MVDLHEVIACLGAAYSAPSGREFPAQESSGGARDYIRDVSVVMGLIPIDPHPEGAVRNPQCVQLEHRLCMMPRANRHQLRRCHVLRQIAVDIVLLTKLEIEGALDASSGKKEEAVIERATRVAGIPDESHLGADGLIFVIAAEDLEPKGYEDS